MQAWSPHPNPSPTGRDFMGSDQRDIVKALARRPGLSRPVKKPVTLRLDQDVVEWFKGHAPEVGHQTEINRVLRRYVAGVGR